MSRKNLAKKIKSLRQERSWSQAQLAEIANLSLRTVQRIENSGYCSPETLLAIAAAFDIDVRELTKLISDGEKSIQWSNLKHILKSNERIVMSIPKFGVVVIGSGLFYLILLLGTVVLGVAAFHQFYDSLPPQTEAELNVGYRQFLFVSILGLAFFLGIWSGIFGIWRERIWQGIVALGCGIFLTVGVFSILPWIQYPHDQYPASFAFVFGGSLPCLISWIIVTAVGKYMSGKQFLNQLSSQSI